MGKHDKTKEDIESVNYNVKEKRKKKKHIGLKIFIVILVILAIAGIIFVKKVKDLDGNWLAVIFGHNKDTLQNLDRLYILAMGESTGMSDTIIICSYDPKTQEAAMLSIPRDTFIGDSQRNASTSDKINSIYNNGRKPEKTLEAVNKLTGLNIQYYILVDTEALVELVDIVGGEEGIEFNVPIDMKYDDNEQDLHINLKAGLQRLNGEQVEQLVRFRHNQNGTSYSWEYGIEDFGRMKTQRDVIKAIAKQTIQFKNVKEIGNIVDIAEKYVQTNMDFKSLKDYIPYVVNMNMDNIRTEQLPGQSEYLNGLSFFLADEEETKEIIDELFKGKVVQEENVQEQNNQ